MSTNNELRKQRTALNRERRLVETELAMLLQTIESTSSDIRAARLDQIEMYTKRLNELTEQIASTSKEIFSNKELQRKNSRSSRKKQKKVHQINGRYVDPSGFNGLVQGGSPGLGKKK